MRYLVKISEIRYGEVEVEAESEEKAKEIATKGAFDFYDSEIADLTAEPMNNAEDGDYCG